MFEKGINNYGSCCIVTPTPLIWEAAGDNVMTGDIEHSFELLPLQD